MIPFAPFEPDRSRYATDATTVATNCVPARDGWGPQPGLAEISQALGAECVGAVYVRDSTEAFYIIAGTATALYRLDATDYSWDDISGASAPYNVPTGGRWSFCEFGGNLIACNENDPPQVYDIDAVGSFTDLGGSPPQAKYVWSAGDFLVLGYISGEPRRVQWSGVGDATFWTVGLRGADYQDLPDGEEVMGGISGEGGAVIFQRRKIRTMTITQDVDFAFQIAVANPYRGTIAPLSIANIGAGEFVYLSEDGFCRNVEGLPIGAERVDAYFNANVEGTKLAEVRGVADPYRKIVWWQYEKSTGAKEILGYNWQLDRWCRLDQDLGEMVVLTTPSLTWDGLDTLYATIDDVDEPFDSRLFRGGAPTFAAFTTGNKLAYFSGPNMAATIETADTAFYPGRRAFLQEARVMTNATSFTLKVGTSAYHGGTVTWGDAITPSSVTGMCHMRRDGLLHRFRLEIASGAEWDHAIGVEPRARPTGRR